VITARSEHLSRQISIVHPGSDTAATSVDYQQSHLFACGIETDGGPRVRVRFLVTDDSAVFNKHHVATYNLGIVDTRFGQQFHRDFA